MEIELIVITYTQIIDHFNGIIHILWHKQLCSDCQLRFSLSYCPFHIGLVVLAELVGQFDVFDPVDPVDLVDLVDLSDEFELYLFGLSLLINLCVLVNLT